MEQRKGGDFFTLERPEGEGRGAGQLGQEGQGRWWAQDRPGQAASRGNWWVEGICVNNLFPRGLKRDPVDLNSEEKKLNGESGGQRIN